MTQHIEIARLGPLGDGVAVGDDGPLYIDRALPGERVEVRFRKPKAETARADLTAIVSPSPHRVAPTCAHYASCGGCTMQHAGDTFVREWKVDLVRNGLARHGLEPALWHDPVFLPAGHRRRATFAARKTKNGVRLGYFARRSHALAEISTCLATDAKIETLRAQLSAALTPFLNDGKTADLFIQAVGDAVDMTITGPVGAKGSPDLSVYESVPAMAHALKISRVSWRAHEHDEPEVLIERSPVLAGFGALSVKLPPLAFLQPTAAGEAALVDTVMAALPAKGKFADLFSGCGTFSGPMLARGSVDAFEADAVAVDALNRSRGSLPLTATRRDLFRKPLTVVEASRFDAIVFDPPRAGAADQARALAAAKTPRIIGVSCNPVTFARDARILADGGYRLDSVRVIDQFAWSHHIELVGVFSKG